MGNGKKTMRKAGRYTWEMFKAAVPSLIMYFCASMILMMLTLKGETVEWNTKKLMWSIVCCVVAFFYHAIVSWGFGGSQYEMLVSGNIKRLTAEKYGDGGYKMSFHKEAKEYRVWKGFAIGGFCAIFPIVFGIVFGCNQSAIGEKMASGPLSIIVMIAFFLSGWSILPFYYMNVTGTYVSYFVSCLFGLFPILVSGFCYIGGAYARRGKRLREQMIAERNAQVETNRERKINYGGLPGTKPRKRK